MARTWSQIIRLIVLALATFITAGPGLAACGSKTYCTQMASCAEADYHFSVCSLDRLDADRDGIPCETLCGKQTSTMQARIQAEPYQADSDDSQSTGFGLLDAGEAAAVEAPAPAFTCAGKRTCKQMTSCAEATHYLTVCGVRSLDGNRDGIACNGLCRR